VGEPYLKDGLGLSRTVATAAAGGLFGAVVVGRVLGSRWTRRQQPGRLLPKALLLTLLGGALLSVNRVPLALVGLTIAGLGIANLYPLALSLCMDVPSEQSDCASARCTAAVGLALMVLPLTVGRLADAKDIGTALSRVVVGLVVLALLARMPLVWTFGKWAESLLTSRRVVKVPD